MKYLELTFNITPYNEAATDVLAALLADSGCDTFLPQDDGLKAYVLADAYDEAAVREAVATTLSAFSPTPCITFTAAAAPDENWNATWESEHHFEPVTLPDGQQLQIIPHQAFGSGEHATTRMMLSLLGSLSTSLREKSAGGKLTVIDAGCGTGILGIAALKLGAAQVFAYDIDEWSVRNAEENYALNGLAATTGLPLGGDGSATILLGDASCLASAPQADILLANINRNILLADMPAFVAQLKGAGHLLLSGFLEADIPALAEAATALGLTLADTRSDGDWRALHFRNASL